jgi:hypothetical protein
MMILYPLVLGLLESLGQVGMKAVSCLLDVSKHDPETLKHPVFWIWVAFLCLDGFSIILWLRWVYGRFETADCLPIEYGLVTVISVTGGVVFFQEYTMLEPWQLCGMGGCMLFALFGIAIATASARAGGHSQHAHEAHEEESGKQRAPDQDAGGGACGAGVAAASQQLPKRKFSAHSAPRVSVWKSGGGFKAAASEVTVLESFGASASKYTTQEGLRQLEARRCQRQSIRTGVVFSVVDGVEDTAEEIFDGLEAAAEDVCEEVVKDAELVQGAARAMLLGRQTGGGGEGEDGVAAPDGQSDQGDQSDQSDQNDQGEADIDASIARRREVDLDQNQITENSSSKGRPSNVETTQPEPSHTSVQLANEMFAKKKNSKKRENQTRGSNKKRSSMARFWPKRFSIQKSSSIQQPQEPDSPEKQEFDKATENGKKIIV